MVLTVCYATFRLRISEAVRLTPAEIDSKRMVIRVKQGKGGKDRYVMLSPETSRYAQELLGTGPVPGNGSFPVDGPANRSLQSSIDATCREVRQRCGIGKPVTPHSLRHAFAVHLLEAGTNLPSSCCSVIANLATTARYLMIATDKVCATVSPLDTADVIIPTVPDLVPA